jgi:hypothetical protein
MSGKWEKGDEKVIKRNPVWLETSYINAWKELSN